MRFGPLLLCLALVLGCGSSSHKGQEVFTPGGIVAFRPAIDTCTNDGTTGPLLALIVHMSELDTAVLQGNACSLKASSRDAAIFIWKAVASGDIAPGTYPHRNVASDGQVVIWREYDSACNQVGSNVLSSSGNVIIETNDATHVVGSLDVTFPGGDWLRLDFDAPVVTSPSSVCESFDMTGGTPGPGCSAVPCIP